MRSAADRDKFPLGPLHFNGSKVTRQCMETVLVRLFLKALHRCQSRILSHVVITYTTDLSECTYCLKYVELHGRTNTAEPWSIRQMGLYQTHIAQGRMVWVLIASKDWMDKEICSFVEKTWKAEERVVDPFEIQKIVIEQSLRGWPNYLTDLSGRVKTHVSNP